MAINGGMQSQTEATDASAFRRTTLTTGKRQFSSLFRAFCTALLAGVLTALAPSASLAQMPPLGLEPLQACTSSDNEFVCRPTTTEQINLGDPISHIRQVVNIPARMINSPVPLAVTLVGTMTSDVRWNGVQIGQNGVVGRDAASETAGHVRATLIVPRELVRPGRNLVDIRMSAHHRWLPVNVPVQQVIIGPYEGLSTTDPGRYWPALLTAGALILALLYFGAAAVTGRDRREALILAGVSACAAAQLAVETSRSFIDYTYPWHIARIAAILLLAALTSALMVAYAAGRLSTRASTRIAWVSVAISIAASVLLPSFDARTWACLFAAAVICLVCAVGARHRRDGRSGIAVALLFITLLVWERENALDRGYYLFLAALLAVLVAEQVFGLRQVYARLAGEHERNEALTARLANAASTGSAIVSFRHGAAIHRIPEQEIVRITAADDFCELSLVGRRPLLVDGTLKAMGASLPTQFLRVHKSSIVNLAHVAGLDPKPGGGHQLLHRDGSLTPVGRTYRTAVQARLQRGG